MRRWGTALLLCVAVTAQAQSVGIPGLGGSGGGGGGSSAGMSGGGGASTGGGMNTPALPGVPTINNLNPSDASRQQQQQQNAAPDMAPEVKADLGAGTLREPLEENEFQRFVFNATGQKLGLFAQRYFDNAAQRTYAPIDRVPVPADYVLGPGDELYIRAWGSIDVDFRTTIDRNGLVNLPRVGTFNVAGTKAGDIDSTLRAQVGRIFKNFSLNVTLGQLRSIQVFVVGQARKPGSYTVSSLSTLVNVIFASGGPSPNGSMRKVQLKRDGSVVTEIDLYDFLVNGSKARDARLLPGDVIVYGPAGPRAALIGSLDTPAIYELKDGGENIGDVLAYGGGTRASTNLQNAQLERIDASNPRAPRSVQSVELAGAITRMKLRDGDVLTLFGVAPQFSNAVTLRGNVAAPLRYPFSPGMRVSTLIPDRDALITSDYYLRKNKLVQFTETTDISAVKLERDVRNMVDEPNWEYAAIERLNANRISTEIIPFNLGKAVIDRDPANDLELKPGDVVTIFGRADIRNPVASKIRLVKVEGEVSAPGVYQVKPGDTLRSLIARTGGITPDAYIYGADFSRAETRKAQQIALDDAVRRLENQLLAASAEQTANLAATDQQSATQLRLSQAELRKAQLARLRSIKPNGRIALELPTTAVSTGDLPDLTLEDGDRIMIPNKPSFVFAVGAVANSNGLLWRPGRQLTNYLDSAGVEPDADEENIFVVRADGSVQHSTRRGWFNSLEKLELMPGDTVVVPDKTNRETFWTALTRGLKDWSQILYQFGLSAAAIKTLRN
ncbi:MAG: SLBB domain-containing protein [Burkholderiales bacterium]|nr:SLBB domain-containing protein [Burkholderiales bacterium]